MDMKVRPFAEFDGIVLAIDLPEFGLVKGARGAIVDVHTAPDLAYEVEFFDEEGRTIDCVPVRHEHLLPRSQGSR